MQEELILWGLGLLGGGGVVGGTLARVLLRGHRAQLVDDLRKEFVTIDALNSATDRLDNVLAMRGAELATATDLATTAREAAESAFASAQRLEAEQRHQWERTMAEVIQPMRDVVSELREQGKLLAAQTEAVKRLTQQVDQAFSRGA